MTFCLCSPTLDTVISIQCVFFRITSLTHSFYIDLPLLTPITSPSNYVVYYESIKRELKTRPIYECRCDETLKTKAEESTRLVCTGLLEHRLPSLKPTSNQQTHNEEFTVRHLQLSEKNRRKIRQRRH